MRFRYFTTKRSSKAALGRNLVPKPNPPPKMVEEIPKPRGLRALLGLLFEDRTKSLYQDFQQQKLTDLGGFSHVVKQEDKYQFLHTSTATNLLFWYCLDLNFSASDFKRVGPPNSQFKVTRARNPVNLTPWMGYFLEFNDVKGAMNYYEETIGHELCGFPLKLKFTSPDISGFRSHLLEKVPNLTRKSHALILGLPPGYSEHAIIRALWDYDLIENAELAVEKLPIGDIKYGGSPFVIRFTNENEALRFANDFNTIIFPHTEAKVICQIVD